MEQVPGSGGPASSVVGDAVGDHLVGFYDDEGHLERAVVSFLTPGLEQGGAGVIVATPAHRTRFVTALRRAGVDVDDALADDRLVVLDASDLIEAFLRDGTPDPDEFRRSVGDVMARAGQGGRPVRVFGEMVALLWERGNVPAVIALEDAWNRLADEHPFALFCAYPIHAFDDSAAAEAFRAVVDCHSHVLPSEALDDDGGPNTSARLVALLEQQANAERAERDRLQVRQGELEAELERLRDLDRLRNEFVSMVVHDIQSPATVVAALLELLRSNWASLPADAVEEHLATALESIRRVERLTSDILTVARIDSGQFSYVLRSLDLRSVVEQAVTGVRDATGRHIELSAPSDLAPVCADADRQLQVLTNLLTNAVKFSAEGTVVTVAIEQQTDRQLVHVRDEGIGIARNEQVALFLPFSRLHDRRDRQARGTGLGLHTAKALVEGQGGRIWVDSEPGKGSTFTYTVPLADT
ncbi:MEDS domain-containing protein [Egicoccus halophilus]|uniref:MEDS domain-containing protein n=1 Tax=Egicoccus halophilus TaxID=1670830 RepID=UPI0013EEB2D6|nr:MEDS domain-containing protein [Egicoccus halophilus]